MNLIDNKPGFGVGGIRIEAVYLRDAAGADVLQANVGDKLTMHIEARAQRSIRLPNLGFLINTLSGELVYGISARNLGFQLADLVEGERCQWVAEFEAWLADGSYVITILAADSDGALTGDSGVHHDTRERLGPLVIVSHASSRIFTGVGNLPGQFTVERVQ